MLSKSGEQDGTFGVLRVSALSVHLQFVWLDRYICPCGVYMCVCSWEHARCIATGWTWVMELQQPHLYQLSGSSPVPLTNSSEVLLKLVIESRAGYLYIKKLERSLVILCNCNLVFMSSHIIVLPPTDPLHLIYVAS